MADQVLYSGVACITDLMVKEGLINLDFADVRAVMREMGKAMMGTGEASGERRAGQAAEAAIANPLLDETSMRGAKGLLISISGGRDLTLFEVDEAATRIREEVDPDANIILGATFEESLEGVIRVSVVATGIDTEAQAAAAMEARMADIAAKAAAKPLGQPQAASGAPVLAPMAQAAAKSAPASAVPAQRPVSGTVRLPSQHRPTAAQPAARASDGGISIQPYDPGPYAAIADATQQLQQPQPDQPQILAEPYIPPAPETPGGRVPRIEDFPPHAQRAIEAQREPRSEDERGPLSLLRRLANVGLGRRDEPAREPPPPQSRVRQPLGQSASLPQRQGVNPRGGQRLAAEGNLDPQGRPQPARAQEDELEIPAFLRRQAN
jgi:cell division protein FtsZ